MQYQSPQPSFHSPKPAPKTLDFSKFSTVPEVQPYQNASQVSSPFVQSPHSLQQFVLPEQTPAVPASSYNYSGVAAPSQPTTQQDYTQQYAQPARFPQYQPVQVAPQKPQQDYGYQPQQTMAPQQSNSFLEQRAPQPTMFNMPAITSLLANQQQPTAAPTYQTSQAPVPPASAVQPRQAGLMATRSHASYNYQLLKPSPVYKALIGDSIIKPRFNSTTYGQVERSRNTSTSNAASLINQIQDPQQPAAVFNQSYQFLPQTNEFASRLTHQPTAFASSRVDDRAFSIDRRPQPNLTGKMAPVMNFGTALYSQKPSNQPTTAPKMPQLNSIPERTPQLQPSSTMPTFANFNNNFMPQQKPQESFVDVQNNKNFFVASPTNRQGFSIGGLLNDYSLQPRSHLQQQIQQTPINQQGAFNPQFGHSGMQRNPVVNLRQPNQRQHPGRFASQTSTAYRAGETNMIETLELRFSTKE